LRDKLQGSIIALHGPPKVGKTQLCSKFPGPVQFIASELGHKFIPQDQRKILLQLAPDTGWDTLSQWIASSPRGFKTLVVDTVSGLYDLCMENVCAKNGWSHPEDAPRGKGGDALKREFYRKMGRLVYVADINKATLIFIDHSKLETIETSTENYEKVTFSMTGTARRIILPVPDHLWYLGYGDKDPKAAMKNDDTSPRTLFIGGSNRIEAGCRDPQVRVKTIRPLSKTKPYEQIVSKLYGESE
jgi:hypothetical protein